MIDWKVAQHADKRFILPLYDVGFTVDVTGRYWMITTPKYMDPLLVYRGIHVCAILKFACFSNYAINCCPLLSVFICTTPPFDQFFIMEFEY